MAEKISSKEKQMSVEIEPIDGVLEFGSAYIVRAPCARCGLEAEGRVARSRREPDSPREIALAWAEEIISRKTELLCHSCMAKGGKNAIYHRTYENSDSTTIE